MKERGFNVLGVQVSTIHLDTAIEQIANATLDPNHAGFITVTGMHGVVESQKDLELKKIHNLSFLTTPDGMSLVWVGKLLGNRGVSRVYGPDLMEEIFRQSEGSGLRHYLFGGAEGVATELKSSLLQKFPKSEIVGETTPPFRPLNAKEEHEFYDELKRTRPHCVWVGLSTPKQERFMHDFLQKFPKLNEGWGHGVTMLGVGAAFDFHSGRAKQAPDVIQRAGFEWLFRLIMEPRRLWRRYIFGITHFLGLLFLQLTGLRKFPIVK